MRWTCLCLAVLVPALVSGQSDGDLRLVNNGGATNIGRLEVFHAGRWGTVCRRWFSGRAAEVACKQMGFPGGTWNPYMWCWRFHGRYECGWWHSLIWMDVVLCNGNEYRLSSCPRLPWGWHGCNHWYDVVLECNPRPKWWIEWSKKDDTENVPMVPGSWAYARLVLYRRTPPQMWHYVWRWTEGDNWYQNWQKNMKINVYARDDGSTTAGILKDYQVAHVHIEEVGTKEPYDFIDIFKRAIDCDDLLRMVKSVTCTGNEEEEVPIDFNRSSCWNRKYEVPYGTNWLQESWQLNNGTLVMSNTTLPDEGAIVMVNDNTTVPKNDGKLLRRTPVKIE